VSKEVTVADKSEVGSMDSTFFFEPNFSIEADSVKNEYKFIAGIDEAGRGSLAGPLSVGMVIFPAEIYFTYFSWYTKINDSKKLTEKKRIEALSVIKKESVYSSFVFIEPEIIDKLNINGATEVAIKELIASAKIAPDFLLIDGNFNFKFTIPSLSVKKGDSKSLSIAAASIVAKVNRDNLMDSYHKTYPEYNFIKNKGYGTREHRDALHKIGGSPLHRKSYEPFKSLINR